jgi:hypothetical protein
MGVDVFIKNVPIEPEIKLDSRVNVLSSIAGGALKKVGEGFYYFDTPYMIDSYTLEDYTIKAGERNVV